MSDSYKIVICTTHDLPSSDVRSFVFAKWLRSLRYENDFFKLIESKAYWLTYQRLVSAILDKPETKMHLAVLTEDPDVILGFSISRGNVLDYVYVHKHQRRLGIGARLVPPGIDTITHVTKTGLTIWGTKYGQWKFNPFA